MERISGFDTGKGIAVLGMIIAHTFEGGICQWDYDLETAFMKKIPLWLLFLFSPLALILLMGLFFTFISSITCTLSVIHKENNGNMVRAYITYRFMFAIVLKGMELFCTALWKEYGIFETMKLQFPIVQIPRYSHTLDSVGFCGWFVPLLVFGIRKTPFKSKPFYQVGVLSVIALVLLSFSNPIATFCMTTAHTFEKYDMNVLSLLFSKFGSGPFMLAQTLPFGIIGGCIAILITEFPTCKELWIYDFVFSPVTVIVAIITLFFTEDFWGQVSHELKPPAVRLMELLVELNIIVIGIYLLEDPRRPASQRKKLKQRGIFLRRISVVSLTAFIFEQFVCWETMKLFYMIFGLAVNTDTKEYLWNVPTTIGYAVFTTGVDLVIIRVWELIHFRLSCEYFMGLLLSLLFNKPYNRVEYEHIIYNCSVC